MTTFTHKTWADLQGRGISRSHTRGWMELHDLATEAFEAREDLGLPFDAFRELVSAANNGLPINIRVRHPQLRSREETTRTYVVEHFGSYTPNHSNLRVRAWGFTFTLALENIVSVEVPKQVFHG